jgi:hypothetical protein
LTLLGLIFAFTTVLHADLPEAIPVYVRLIHKFSQALNGLDLSGVSVGDVMCLADRTGLMLVNEGWAEKMSNCADAPPDEQEPPSPQS